jgi:hypothetical protein
MLDYPEILARVKRSSLFSQKGESFTATTAWLRKLKKKESMKEEWVG